MVDLIQGADEDVRSGNLDSDNIRNLDELTRTSGVKRFAVVDFKLGTVIKFISARRAMLITTPRRRVGKPRKKEIIIVGEHHGAPHVINP